MARQVPWLRIVAEGVAIVTSILLAFAIQAWWEERQERTLELEYATRLKVDLARDTLRMGQGVRQNEAKLSVLNALLDPARISSLVSDPAAAALQLRFSTYQGMNELAVGAFTEMQSSGRLILLEDAELRDALVSYYTLHGLVTSALAESYGEFRHLLTSAVPGSVWTANPSTVNPSEVEDALVSLASHPELEAIANTEFAYAAETLRWHRRQQAAAAELLEALEAAYPSE